MYRSTIVGQQDGQTVDVIMGWTTGTATNATDADTLAQRVGDFWNLHVMSLRCNVAYSTSQVDVVGVDDPTVEAHYASAHVGGNSTDQELPAFVVANVKLETGLRGRSYRGRFGVPGISVTAVDPDNSNLLESTFRDDLESSIASFMTAVSTGAPNPHLAVISLVSGGTPRPAPLANNVTSATVQSALGSRVSRKG